MAQWFLVGAIVVAALLCPALMWLGRRGIGPGCAVCPPRRGNGQSLDELKARQQSLKAEIEKLQAAEQRTLVAASRD